MHIYCIQFETPQGARYRDSTLRIVVQHGPESGGLQEAIAACPPAPDGMVLDSASYYGPITNSADWQHV